ncbi:MULTISPECIES: hypothetical protein [Saccharothrix]|uniref:hypothetical protein n=1 Tax=Saccharothrix TaxID=2071 RepID=UPI00093F394F|nr:hypothetical protein [Saccharothrix sp. CB00851]OKI14771.1 hypothetical protein A6A25_15055 [Saccharothrix sp. CB00851]
MVDAHVATLVADLTRIVEDGVASGDFTADDPAGAAEAVLAATARFHDPVHAPSWSSPEVDRSFDAVVSLLVAGLQAAK